LDIEISAFVWLVVHNSLKFEEGWNTDSEEEAFVDKLAADLMEADGGGQADLDDEDPDMDDWGDMYDGSDDNSETHDGSNKDDDDDEEEEEDGGGLYRPAPS